MDEIIEQFAQLVGRVLARRWLERCQQQESVEAGHPPAERDESKNMAVRTWANGEEPNADSAT
jgi:hypothetical protein